MAKVREQSQSVEDLERQQTQLLVARGEIEGRIRSLQEALDLAVGRDTELAKLAFAGKDTAKERARLREQSAAKLAEIDREGGDLSLLGEELARLEKAIEEGLRRGKEAEIEASTQGRKVGIPAVARGVREALAGTVTEIEALTADWQAERQLRHQLTGSFEAPGELVLQRLGSIVADFLMAVDRIGEGRP